MAQDMLTSILKDVPITETQKNIFLNYLCSDEGSFLNYREVGERFGMTKQRVHQIVDRYSKYLNIIHRDREILGTLYVPIRKMLRKHKGAISINSYIEDNKDAYDVSEISLRRMLRFASTVSKFIDIDASKDLFWESKSPCVKCKYFTTELQSHILEESDVLEEVDNFCKTIDCKHRQNRTFDKGQLDLHIGLTKVITDETTNIPNPPTQINTTGSETIHQIKSTLFTQKQHQLLEFILSKGAKVPKIGLESFCRIKRIDLKAELNTINDAFYKNHGLDLLVFDSSDENWELSDTGLPLILEASTVKPEDQENTYQSEEDRNFELHVLMLKNTLRNAKQSYKFYWALALLRFSQMDRGNFTYTEMASMMCSFAWNDVFAKEFKYNDDDLVPAIVRKIYVSTRLVPNQEIEDIYAEALKTINPGDVSKILKHVPSHFLLTYKESNISSEELTLYRLSNDMVIDLHKFTNEQACNLMRIVNTMKHAYFQSIPVKE